MQLTPSQTALFWRLWARVESEVFSASNSKADRENKRHEIILRATGKTSLRLVQRTSEFDRLMCACAEMAGDYKDASYWAIAGERRTAHMIGECARQIGEIAGVHNGWDYCRSTFVQAGFPSSWLDIPGTLLASAFKMLDTHRRRLLIRDWNWSGSADGTPLGFNPDYHYECVLGCLTFKIIEHHHSAVA
jgi:hypothetical protein